MEAHILGGGKAGGAVKGNRARLGVDVLCLRRAAQRQRAGNAHGHIFSFQRRQQP